jgi:SAM-dependent methyltransferase
MALPFAEDRFDAAIMALVIFFVPEPAKGVAEMVRVVRPGGLVASYAWDMFGGGFPLEPIRLEMNALGLTLPAAPRSDASRMEALRGLWAGAGLAAVETREITVRRTFVDFDDFWTTGLMHASWRAIAVAMPPGDLDVLRSRVRAKLPADAAGRITCGARANAIKGRVPG